MARLAAVFGTSHSIMLVATLEDWQSRFRERDKGLSFFDDAGKPCSYEEALTLAPPEAPSLIAPEAIAARHGQAQRAMARMKAAIAEAALDALIIIGDDQHELFQEDHEPSIGLYYGETIRNAPPAPVAADAWYEQARQGYREAAVEAHHSCDSALSRHLIAGLIGQGFDISAIKALRADQFEGHAYGFIHRHYLAGRVLPVVPVFLNTYYPPNQPTPRRCVELGQALAELVAAYPGEGRIGLIASGGLSHFRVEAAFDAQLIDAFRRQDTGFLAGISPAKLQSGSSEIRNWLVGAGAARGLDLDWVEYIPGYRSPALTGTGLCFAAWR